MISFENARKKAKELLDTISNYTEEEDAYIFVDKTQKWDGEVVILKRDGTVLSYSEYVVSKDNKQLFIGDKTVNISKNK